MNQVNHIKKSFKKSSFLLLMFLGLLSCTENSFTTIVDIDIADHEPRLTLTARIILADSNTTYPFNNLVILGKSSGINSTDSNNEIRGAKISLLENGEVVDTAFETRIKISDWNTGKGSSYAYALAFRDYKPGAAYQIIAEKNGFPSIAANQTFIEADSIASMKYIKDGRPSTDNGGVSDEINLSIANVNTDNYYLLDAAYLHKNRQADSLVEPYRENFVSINSDDPLLQATFEGGLLIKGADILRNDNMLIMYIESYYQSRFGKGDMFKMQLHTITQDQYLFLLSSSQYIESNGNPFAEPSEVYTNVENGFGIFSIESITSKTILLK